jgi:hypothetical protein
MIINSFTPYQQGQSMLQLQLSINSPLIFHDMRRPSTPDFSRHDTRPEKAEGQNTPVHPEYVESVSWMLPAN